MIILTEKGSTMDDYIKREDAIEYLVDNMVWMDADGIETSEEDKRDAIAELINGVPSADVAPVRHGRWIVGEQMPMHDIKGNLSWGNWYTCNQCEFKTYAIERHITQYNYCPNCGAKMDEEETKE